ncbi:tRNA (adenine(22)-N(1))-methyltransferase [Deinococcus maricopensis]|uniref:tRNA (Adenine-N(1)-)-methyltransferase n=1 Tax=Deinococcus maricopensis (strain DSM 21211 / LMG 22137 / NRRL B-23946 / LB-34) TaxID=709986 RepID=E8U3X8_DEIML|nr:tRNA (adenine(22)-N(1))-methyltransferase TrmK [Deinococcus maricopensis]ADV65672.1 protein of unknown function DUF633 [Deinococcus maricopensis DSM 21211]
MTLDARLEAAAQFIRAAVHADIGSDHAALPVALLTSGRVERAVIVEKTEGPLRNARAAVARAGLTDRCEVREGDGLAPLTPGEVESASMTGMGVRTMLGVLARAGDRLPPALVLQPNDDAAPLRAWARAQAYHLRGEALAPGFWTYPVLHLRRAEGPDPAYEGVPGALAERFGPHLLRARDPQLLAVLERQRARLAPLTAHARADVLRHLSDVQSALAWMHT